MLSVPAVAIGPDGALVAANDAWTGLVGTADTSKPWSWLDPVFDEDRERVYRVLTQSLTSQEPAEIEFTVRSTDGGARALHLDAGPLQDGSGLLGLVWDVTERRRQEEWLEYMAGHDALTGLANRWSFEEALKRASSRADRGAPGAVLLLDMDNLKRYNDARGHLQGDRALVSLARELGAVLRGGDLLARVGGDEFAVLLEDTALPEAAEIAERMRATVSDREFIDGGREHGLGVSIGVVELDAGVDERTTIDRADAALYAAKNAGRDRVVLWEPSLGGMDSGGRLEREVRSALEAGGVKLTFQPVVRLSDGCVVYFESLARLCCIGGEVLPPMEFLPIVERAGLMSMLTLQVLRNAVAALESEPGACVSINLSAADLAGETQLADVEQVLEHAGECADRLLVEVPESALVENVAAGQAWIGSLRSHGVRVVLDDFGTRLGALLLLREIDATFVKFSPSVTRVLGADPTDSCAFLVALRELVESQHKTAVASFLEDEQTLRHVCGAGIGMGQGFGVRRPDEDLGALVAELPRALCEDAQPQDDRSDTAAGAEPVDEGLV